MISALPDVKRVKLSPKDEFMILACDGIWNSLSSEEVVEFVRTRIQKGEKKMSAICEEVSEEIEQFVFSLQLKKLQVVVYNALSVLIYSIIYFLAIYTFQLFTKCLAPNTCGDGTGCDNMTAVIIQFQPLLLEKFQSSDKCADEIITSKKRQATPITNVELTTSSSKKIKTDDKLNDDE